MIMPSRPLFNVWIKVHKQHSAPGVGRKKNVPAGETGGASSSGGGAQAGEQAAMACGWGNRWGGGGGRGGGGGWRT